MKLTKKEKFSIRKHKFGVSSILVGSIIGLTMLMTKEAEAEEVERNLSKQQIQHNNDATGDTQDYNNYNNEISNQEATTQNKQITQS
ncbi:MAG: YSIRK-type signal peptide-containing protein, partial [Staphylococcus lugdunensis]|nr:YSIRK-type signal peptide-containing protein [Staphylococcus lugdunensis]